MKPESVTVRTLSLLNVCATNSDGSVDGYWIQDHIGTLDEALEKASQTSATNSNINVVVVDHINCPVASIGHWTKRRVAS